jgi:hypothetical protein
MYKQFFQIAHLLEKYFPGCGKPKKPRIPLLMMRGPLNPMKAMQRYKMKMRLSKRLAKKIADPF